MKRNQTFYKRNLLLGFLFMFLTNALQAQIHVAQLSWSDGVYAYSGLFVMQSNDKGILSVKHFCNGIWIWVHQDISIRRQYDIYGNCTTILTGYNVVTNPPCAPYMADIIYLYPDGQEVAYDALKRPCRIFSTIVPNHLWRNKFKEFGIR